jgi:hypothetical protein
MIKVLGMVDLIAGVIFLAYGLLNLMGFGLISGSIISFLGIVILCKGLVFSIGLDVASFIDIAIGFVMVFVVSVELPFVIVAIISIFLIQKGAFSLAD